MTTKHQIERRKGTPRAWVARNMRLPLIIASILCPLVHADELKSGAPQLAPGSKKMGLTLKVKNGGWGKAQPAAIETVLYSVADELMSRLPKKLTVPIVVTHTDDAPVALYDRGPGGEYRVQLHASGESWHLYVYEFAHELCHILSNYEENVGPQTVKHNQWFEETLCETASLFALRKLAATWESAPPEPKWSEEAKKLRRFFDHLVSEGHRQLPADTPLSGWLRDNEQRLRNDPYRRNENEVVANLLLPLFQENPQNWAALNYLNLDPSDARNSLSEYLRHWYQNAPPEHKSFVAGILALFKLDDVAPTTTLAAASGSKETTKTALLAER
ncbi:MAG: hypothetical protein HYU74_04450 [Dechloromonas sp.]|nr:hypothetical protein [Dechloromonas sp.]